MPPIILTYTAHSLAKRIKPNPLSGSGNTKDFMKNMKYYTKSMQSAKLCGNSMDQKAWVHQLMCSVLITQSCLTILDPMDCSLPGFSVHGVFQARILEWVAISFLSCNKMKEMEEKHKDGKIFKRHISFIK